LLNRETGDSEKPREDEAHAL